MKGALDPLLAPALELERRPVVVGRGEAVLIASDLVSAAEKIAMLAHGERDAASAAQLSHVSEAIAVAAISLMAYSRGVVPTIRPRPQSPTIITG